MCQAEKGASQALKSEYVIPGVKRKGSDHSLLSSVIAAYEHISLFGNHNKQLAHRDLKSLFFLHSFATSTLIIHACESLFFIKEIRGSSQTLHVSPWSLVLKSREHSIRTDSPVCSMKALDLQLSFLSSLSLSIHPLSPPSLSVSPSLWDCVSVTPSPPHPVISCTSLEMACC